jgi:hypothetical protein
MARERWDGAGVLLKRELWKEQIKPNARRLQNAYDVVTFLKEEATRQHVAHPNVRRIVRKYFSEAMVANVDRSHLFEC